MSVSNSTTTLPQRLEIAFWTAVIPLMKEAPLPRLRRPVPARNPAAMQSATRPGLRLRSTDLPLSRRPVLVQALALGLAGLALGFVIGYLMVFLH